MLRSILGLALLGVAAGQDFLPCANDRSFVGRCLNPRAQGSVSFEFQPLFPSNPTFVYAFDVQDEDESDGPNVAPERMSKVGFWLEYTDHNLDPQAKQETHLAVLLNGNITGTPGGGHNGCDGVWGAECSNSIMELVKLEMRNETVRWRPNMAQVMGRLVGPFTRFSSGGPGLGEAVANLPCPRGIFTAPYMVQDFGQFAVEDGSGRNTRILPSGNSSSTHILEIIKPITYDELIDRVAVAMISRAPTDAQLYDDPDNIQLEMMCVKAEPLEGGQGTPGNETDDGAQPDGPPATDDAVKHAVWHTGLLVLVAVLISSLAS